MRLVNDRLGPGQELRVASQPLAHLHLRDIAGACPEHRDPRRAPDELGALLGLVPEG
ncbi:MULTISPECIES: hypothetical protein [Kitasatospora]|uniref:Uncharacterized protein n=1 Tax=Kitasatospora setae (strain ATCC 33774 / DSM 43861 / JCM 3304 / KCC A-0304 / NBRC 14216 / KM-6054) TaxID=452652 RepID=E4N9V0_KITSK|nr:MULTISPECIES: hypothetical protein [Kitasatospora]BAJ27981.1 hypothetical protein KSE_21590 [Kitasatospora setae KM-6054]